ncbi:transposase, partial [Psychrobacter piechaudii]|uniref:transposase n=1 Tax=Psychrobacter piechaudii TaxID=1945521 RepID=UPI00244A081A
LDIQKIIEDSGHTILWLPPYSPDLNPIEQTWAWVKKKRQDWGIDCIDTLFFYFLWLCDCFLRAMTILNRVLWSKLQPQRTRLA